MWFCDEAYKNPAAIDKNDKFLVILGELDEKECRLTLIEFLRNNIGLATEILTGIKLAPFQEINLRGLMTRQYSMCVHGRGCGKTFTAAIFCIMQAIMEPNSKILIAGPTFRTSRFIFNKIEELLAKPEALLARQAFDMKPLKRNDIHQFSLSNGSTITAIPLNGEKIRGFRANKLVIDEYLLMSKEIIETVLVPFLTAPQDISERQSVREQEDELIRLGAMTENDRMEFEDKTQLVALSSASYTFENLFLTYKEYLGKIYAPRAGVKDGEKIKSKYFVSQMAWDSIPTHMINTELIEQAANGRTSGPVFDREYNAKFSDGSEGYFAAAKMNSCTVPDGQTPTVQIKGDPDSEYILAIDPSFANNPQSDDFAMTLLELDDKTESGIVAHVYGQHGKDLKDHIKYFHYILTNFNVVAILIDNAGYQFLDSANESECFLRSKINVKTMDVDISLDGEGLIAELSTAKKSYNRTIHRIAFRQAFGKNEFIRNANELLQGYVDYKKIWFPAKAQAHASTFNRFITTTLDEDLYRIIEVESKDEFIEHIGYMVDVTKKECALIEVSNNARGTQTFDLPSHLNNEKGSERARRDNYTSLLLSTWLMKTWYDMKKIPTENVGTFTPFWVNPV